MNQNIIMGKQLAKEYNRKFGIITYSGTLAIEYSIKILNLKEKSKILVLSTVCSSIINTIIKCGMIPLIIQPDNGYSLTDDEIDRVIKRHQISCILLVHQYGMMNKINVEKYKEKNIKIIEDVSQIYINKHIKNSVSDIIITSFGSTKPLSYGIGGAILFDNENYFNLIDYCDNCSREKDNILLSYAYPKKIKIKPLIKKANKIIFYQRKISKKIYNKFNNNNDFKLIYDGNESSYHRLILIFEKKIKYDKYIELFNKYKLMYQIPHEVETIDLPIAKKSIKIMRKRKLYFILIRTRNVRISSQVKKLAKSTKIMNNML